MLEWRFDPSPEAARREGIAAEPKRDWIVEPDFDLATAIFSGPAAPLGEQFHECYTAAEMFCWLCGQHEHFYVLGGQSWPLPAKRNDLPYGFPAALAKIAPPA